jgi:hypothetical protein
VGERHVADAEVVEGAQEARLVLDGVAAFDADEGGDSAGAAGRLDLIGGDGEDEVIRVAGDDVVGGWYRSFPARGGPSRLNR